ncbi:MAG: CBS domain-containing protein [Verrucomicrobia bacterium]|nr:CBS domain-containing protein [Verrucomicrobiota bacterium]
MTETIKNQSLADEFVLIYNRLAEYLIKKYGCSNGSFTNNVKQVSSKDPSVKRYADRLQKFAELRNAIIHHEKYPVEIIAEPAQSIVREFQMIEAAIIRPKKIYDLCTRDPRIFKGSETLSQSLNYMKECEFSQIIVEMKNYFTLFTAESFTASLENISDDLFDFSVITLESVLNKQSLPQFHDYIKRDATINEAHDAFTQQSEKESIHKRKTSRLYALIVTANGKNTEKPLGILTPWDLIQEM